MKARGRPAEEGGGGFDYMGTPVPNEQSDYKPRGQVALVTGDPVTQ